MNVVLDKNIFDLLQKDSECLANLVKLIDGSGWRILAPSTLVDELAASPFGGVPSWLTVEEVIDEVFILGYTKLGSGKLGHGEIYSEHKGKSNNIKDAVIIDFAVKKADAFVSEDKRSRNRLKKMNTNIAALTYAEFKNLTSQCS